MSNSFGWLPTCRSGVIHWRQTAHHGDDVCGGGLCFYSVEFPYYYYRTKPTVQEFFCLRPNPNRAYPVKSVLHLMDALVPHQHHKPEYGDP